MILGSWIASAGSKIKPYWSWLIDACFPITCVVCRREGDWLCADHRDQISLRQHHECPICRQHQPTPYACQWCASKSYLDQLWVIADYDQVIKSFVHAFKYQLASEAISALQPIVTTAERPGWDNEAVLMPLPLHPRRQRERGFNQAQLIANLIGEVTSNKVIDPLVRRTIYRAHQAGLSAQQRRANIGDDFIIDVDKIKIDPDRRIIIVDDVYTTGATMQAVAKVLKMNGFSKVSGVVLARGE